MPLPRMRILLLLSVVLIGLAGPLVSSARADNPQHAKELFQQGTTFFDLGQFDKAVESWEAGYKEKPDPVFLYNIAQAYRLSGDGNKAIFFYRGYLRNLPKAPNRAEVEQKIAAIQQKLAAEPDRARPPEAPKAEPSSAPPAPAPPPAPPPVVTPPPVYGTEPPPAALPPAAGLAPPESPPTVEAAQAAAAPPAEAFPHLELGVGIGFDTWGSSVQGNANPSFALALSAGYVVWKSRSNRLTQFRLGGALGYTFLQEGGSKDTFLSLLVVPTFMLGLTSRLAIFAELGVGVLGIWGLEPGSLLLARGTGQMIVGVNGGQSLLEIRPALGLQFQLNPKLGIFAAIAADDSPKAPHFYAAIQRTELLFGLSMRTFNK
jgi:hypothetical protein